MRRPKAVPSEGTTRVFISATSKDLGTVRELVEEALLTMDCMPIEQTNFPPDYRSVREMIEEKVAGCEAVIQIVGIRYGAEPDPSTLPEGAARRSYTQMEADIARKLEKKLYLFVCPEDFPYDQATAESEELQGLQRAYRAEIAKGEILRTEVKDREELGRKVRELQFELEKLKSEIGRNQRRVVLSLVVLLLLLGGIGAGIWRLPGVVKKEVRYDRGRAREQLVADIKAEAQKKIVEAGDDWRKTIEIEKWRDQQLSELDRFLDRIQQTFDAGQVTESYRKATDLLAAKGADEALAYLQARGNQRKSQIEMQANQRDQEEAGLRNLLQEELLAASLLETKFRFDDAEAKYRQVLEKSGSWPKARNDFTWFLITRGEVIDPAAGNAKLQEALELCRGTLAFASRQTAPQDWAATQNNLGWVLRDLGERKNGEQCAHYLEQSVVAYRAALEVRTREQLPQDWAATQNSMGIVLTVLGERASGEQSAQYLQQSLAAYRAALEVRTREQLPQRWAATENNLGMVLAVLAERASGEQGAQYSEQSMAAYHAALEVRTREQLPQGWAATQANLGNLFSVLGRRVTGEQGAQYLDQSVAAYRAALEVYTREQSPQDWAATQGNLGSVLSVLGERTSGEQGVQYLQRAVDSLENALSIFTPEAAPYQNSLARADLEKAKAALHKISSH
jgi:tetratricopeptide (TPR) repeat protein